MRYRYSWIGDRGVIPISGPFSFSHSFILPLPSDQYGGEVKIMGEIMDDRNITSIGEASFSIYPNPSLFSFDLYMQWKRKVENRIEREDVVEASNLILCFTLQYGSFYEEEQGEEVVLYIDTLLSFTCSSEFLLNSLYSLNDLSSLSFCKVNFKIMTMMGKVMECVREITTFNQDGYQIITEILSNLIDDVDCLGERVEEWRGLVNELIIARTIGSYCGELLNELQSPNLIINSIYNKITFIEGASFYSSSNPSIGYSIPPGTLPSSSSNSQCAISNLVIINQYPFSPSFIRQLFVVLFTIENHFYSLL